MNTNDIDPTQAEPPIQAFLSYARSDDEEFQFVDPLVKKLRALVRVKSARELKVFVDREAIGWGEDWRDRLGEAVQGAFVFLPIVTATYLNRPNCREEFLTFRSKAETLGVTELILPVVLFQFPGISSDSPDEIARFVESRQYKSIEEGILGGYDSAAWLRVTVELATALLMAVATAESALLDRGDQDVRETAGPEVDDAESDDASGLIELVVDLNTTTEQMTAVAQNIAGAIERLGNGAKKVPVLPNAATSGQAQAWATRIAHELAPPAKDLERYGRDLFSSVSRLDQVLSELQELAGNTEIQQVEEGVKQGIAAMTEQFSELEETEAQMQALLDSLRTAELLSVALRKALRPARSGFTAVRDSLSLLRSWSSVA